MTNEELGGWVPWAKGERFAQRPWGAQHTVRSRFQIPVPHPCSKTRQITLQGFGERRVILLAGQVVKCAAHTGEGLAAKHRTAKPQGQASRGAVTHPQPPTADMGAPFHLQLSVHSRRGELQAPFMPWNMALKNDRALIASQTEGPQRTLCPAAGPDTKDHTIWAS